MSKNRRDRRKNKNRKKKQPKNNTISRREKIYGIIAMVILFLAALFATIYVSF
jgi:cell division protein FtsL